MRRREREKTYQIKPFHGRITRYLNEKATGAVKECSRLTSFEGGRLTCDDALLVRPRPTLVRRCRREGDEDPSAWLYNKIEISIAAAHKTRPNARPRNKRSKRPRGAATYKSRALAGGACDDGGFVSTDGACVDALQPQKS
ncbi:hypothetical protein EVAR_36770_1 [Eumeta japonica]|uniref:Uncharacterized protein n=1 Tax=Eumeta variegata TaxID=151549 RepID=A0A4C1X2A9_EUMVA|nr:hypothetical protein EVAR_36770_1 [Eumeta japonica]